MSHQTAIIIDGGQITLVRLEAPFSKAGLSVARHDAGPFKWSFQVGFPPAKTAAQDYLVLPLWLPLGLAVIANACLWSPRRRREGRCQECGYDLTGLVGCPECGSGRQGGGSPRSHAVHHDVLRTTGLVVAAMLLVLLAGGVSMLWPWGIGGKPAMTLNEYETIVAGDDLIGLSIAEAERILRYPAHPAARKDLYTVDLLHLGFFDYYEVNLGIEDGRVKSASIDSIRF